MRPRDLRQEHPRTWSFHETTSRSAIIGLPAKEMQPLPSKEYAGAPWRQLPAALPLASALQDAIALRTSCRRFRNVEISAEHLATVLRASYGVTRNSSWEDSETLDRAVPSGGGLYPLEAYVLARLCSSLPAGIHHFHPLTNGLEELGRSLPPRDAVGNIFMGQPYVAAASAIVVFTAVFARSLPKYGDRGYRYLLLEAGHAGQNLSLAATALGLGVLSIGGFFDHQLANVLGVDPAQEAPLYALALGVPASGDSQTDRLPVM